MNIPRTIDEIVAWYESNKDVDVHAELRRQLIGRLPFERARPFLRPDVTEAQWVHLPEMLTAGGVLTDMRVAWPTTQREIRARCGNCVAALAHRYAAWAWLLGDAQAADALLEPTRIALDDLVKLGPMKLGVVDMNRVAASLEALAKSYALEGSAHVH